MALSAFLLLAALLSFSAMVAEEKTKQVESAIIFLDADSTASEFAAVQGEVMRAVRESGLGLKVENHSAEINDSIPFSSVLQDNLNALAAFVAFESGGKTRANFDSLKSNALVFIKPLDANYSRQPLTAAFSSNGSGVYGTQVFLKAVGTAPSLNGSSVNSTTESDANAFYFRLYVSGDSGTPYSFSGFLDKTKSSAWVFNQSALNAAVAFAPPGNVGILSMFPVNSSLNVIANQSLWIQSADGAVNASNGGVIKNSAVRLNR